MLEFYGILLLLGRGAADFSVARRLYSSVKALLRCHTTEHKCVNVDPRSLYSD
jgi:hypothetical protein